MPWLLVASRGDRGLCDALLLAGKGESSTGTAKESSKGSVDDCPETRVSMCHVSRLLTRRRDVW